jgi:hypothetical protein
MLRNWRRKSMLDLEIKGHGVAETAEDLRVWL